ncbi:MAG: VOC family protein [Bacteroidota bacterium]
MKAHYAHAATVLPVKDVAACMAFYHQKLGFDVSFQWGDPVDYVVLKAGDISLHLSKREDGQSPSKSHVALLIFVTDIDTLYDRMVTNGVRIVSEIGNRDYQMRDFDIADPEGHIISFGQGG